MKYKDLQIEISRMWNVKTKVVAVVVGALGTMSDNFNKEITLILGKPSAESIQNIALNGSAHILRKYLVDRRTDIERTNVFVCVHSI